MTPSVDAVGDPGPPSPKAKNNNNDKSDDILIMSSLSAAISSLDNTTNNNNTGNRADNFSDESRGAVQSNNYFTTSNRVKGEGSSSSSLSSTVGSATMWGSPPPAYGTVSNSALGNYLPTGNDSSNQLRRDDIYPPATTNQQVNNTNPNQAWRHSNDRYQPTQGHGHTNQVSYERKKGMGTISAPSPSHSSLFNHGSLNDLQIQPDLSSQYRGNLKPDESSFNNGGMNKAIGSIGSIDQQAFNKKSAAIGSPSVAASPTVSSGRPNSSYQDRTSQQLFHLTGNMNAVIPPDNDNSVHRATTADDNNSRKKNSRQNGNGNWNSSRGNSSNNNNPEPVMHNVSGYGGHAGETGPGAGGATDSRLNYTNANPNHYQSVENGNYYPPQGYVPPMMNNAQQQHYPHSQYPMSSNSQYAEPNSLGGPSMSKTAGPPTDSNQFVPRHPYAEQPPVSVDNFQHVINSNPQQQIFYMAVPMQNGAGQMLQPVQMVQLPNGQSTFVMPAHQPPVTHPNAVQSNFLRKDKDMMGVIKPHQQFGNDRDGINDTKSQYISNTGNQSHGLSNPLAYNPAHSSVPQSNGNIHKKKDKRSKGKPGHIVKHQEASFPSNAANMGQYSGDLSMANDYQFQRHLDDQLNTQSHPLSSKPSSDAITALYHSPQRPPLSSLLGHVRRLSRDQVGCRLLQQSLDEDGPYAATAILNEGLPFLTEAMTDPFGNYLFQKILEKVTAEEKLLLVSTVGPRLVNAALNLHGTRSVQKVVEMSVGDSKAAEIVTQSLAPAAARLCIDSHGNHVIQRILQKLPHVHSKFVFDAVANSVGDVARHRHGCCVIQRCLDSPPSPARSNLVKRIVEKSLDLMQDAYGNYVVQYVLDVCGDDEAAAVCESVVGKIGLLAIQKFSSNVMEKCLERSSDRVQELHLLELSAPDKIRELMADPFGNYVVQKALSVATHAQAVRLVEAMRPHLPGMRNTAGGRRIVAKIVRRFPRFNPNFGIDDVVSNNMPVDQQFPMHQHHVNYSHPSAGMGYMNSQDHNGYGLGMMNGPPLLGGHNNDHHQNGLMSGVETYSVDNVRLHNNSGHA